MAIIVLIGVNALFVAGEFALVALDPSRVEANAERRPRRSKIVLALLDRLSFHLAGAQLGITVSSLILGFVAQDALSGVLDVVPGLEPGGASAAVVALAIATLLQMVFGELVPKSLAIGSAERVAYGLGPLLRIYGIVAWPITRSFNGIANVLVRRLGTEPTENFGYARSREEIAHLIESSGESGALDEGEGVLLTRSIRFGIKDAADVLVPRPDMVTLSVDASIADLRSESMRTGHSRFPVCGDDLDDVAGVVDVRDIFTLPPEERFDSPIATILSEILVVPESRELPELLADMEDSRSRLALVVDEHGGTAGLVTVEDLFEELVGDIADEYDVAVPLTPTLRAGVYELDGSLHADEVREAVGAEIPDGPYETLAGFMLSEFGRLPDVGDSVVVDAWSYTVTVMVRRRISRVSMRPVPRNESAPSS